MAKQRGEKLTKIPGRKKEKASGPTAAASVVEPVSQEPDLSYIAEDLRQHAVPIDDVIHMVDNPREHKEDDLEDTKESLAEFGQVELLVVNKRPGKAVVLNGNGRLSAALELGWEYIAVTFVDLDDDRARTLAMVLNRTGEGAGWNKDNVAKALKAVRTGNRPRLDAMMTKLAEKLKLVPKLTPEAQPVAFDAQKPEGAKLTCPQCGHEFTANETSADTDE